MRLKSAYDALKQENSQLRGMLISSGQGDNLPPSAIEAHAQSSGPGACAGTRAVAELGPGGVGGLSRPAMGQYDFSVASNRSNSGGLSDKSFASAASVASAAHTELGESMGGVRRSNESLGSMESNARTELGGDRSRSGSDSGDAVQSDLSKDAGGAAALVALSSPKLSPSTFFRGLSVGPPERHGVSGQTSLMAGPRGGGGGSNATSDPGWSPATSETLGTLSESDELIADLLTSPTLLNNLNSPHLLHRIGKHLGEPGAAGFVNRGGQPPLGGGSSLGASPLVPSGLAGRTPPFGPRPVGAGQVPPLAPPSAASGAAAFRRTGQWQGISCPQPF